MRLANTQPLRLLGLIAMISVVAGCSGGKPMPDFVEHLVPTQGKVTMKGKPLEGAVVAFHPADSTSEAIPAFGGTDAAGAYELKTMAVGHGPQPGVVAGNYIVTISKIVMKDGSPIPADMTTADAEAEGAREVIPARFTNPERSPLKTQVANGDASLDFDL